jgi:NADPH-dependent 2,4-dienoyl-CoA reductase/sulfur reductase-like enzyme
MEISTKYLIVGSCQAGDAAARAIREVDPEGSILMVTADRHAPYKRPPLSKGLWFGRPVDRVFIHNSYQQLRIKVLLNTEIVSLDPEGHVAVDREGNSYKYQKLLLATGGRPRVLPFGEGHIVYLRTLDDYFRIRGLADAKKSFLVIGGGFIGGEIAAALNIVGCPVTMIFPEKGILERILPQSISSFVTDYYRSKGIQIITEDVPTALDRDGDRLVVTTGAGQRIMVDGIVAGIGLVPNVELAAGAGLAVDNGIAVDELCCTSNPDIYAAGDVAYFYAPALGKRIRVEHEDNAVTQGQHAGRNMAGMQQPYHHLPYFYSDLFDLGWEAVGDLDPRLETFADWREPNREGAIFYLAEGRVRGVLLWNTWGKVDAARSLIASGRSYSTKELVGMLTQG